MQKTKLHASNVPTCTFLGKFTILRTLLCLQMLKTFGVQRSIHEHASKRREHTHCILNISKIQLKLMLKEYVLNLNLGLILTNLIN